MPSMKKKIVVAMNNCLFCGEKAEQISVLNSEWFFPRERIRQQLLKKEFRIQEKVTDPTGSGSDPNYLKHSRKCQENRYLVINKKKNQPTAIPFKRAFHFVYCTIRARKNYNFDYFSAFNFFLNPDAKKIIPDPDPGKVWSGSGFTKLKNSLKICCHQVLFYPRLTWFHCFTWNLI